MKFIEVTQLKVIWEDTVRISEFGTWQVVLFNNIQRQEAGQLNIAKRNECGRKQLCPSSVSRDEKRYDQLKKRVCRPSRNSNRSSPKHKPQAL